MPPDGVCCNDGSGSYCPFDEYCVPNGCCPNGEKCSGGGGTITFDDFTGTGALPTATSAPGATHTVTHNSPTTVEASPTTAVQNTNAPNTFVQATTNLNAQTTAAVVTNSPATTSTGDVFKGSGNAVSALSHGLERYALILIAGGQLLLGW